jgi:hypothetical protein
MIEVISYKSVNGLEFGASSKKVIEVFGKPESINENKMYYSISDPNDYDFIIILDNNKFVEFLLCPRTKATINGIPIAWTLKEMLPIIESDNNTIISSGDYGIILPKYGMYVGAFHISDDDDNDKSVEFLAKDVMDEYLIEEIEENAKPFNLEELKKEIKNSNLEIDLP